MIIFQFLQIATGFGTLASVLIVAFLMANGHRISARRVSGFAIALLAVFVLITALMMVL